MPIRDVQLAQGKMPYHCLAVEDRDASYPRRLCNLSSAHMMWVTGRILQRVNTCSQTSTEEGVDVERAACGSCIAHDCEGQLLGSSSSLHEAVCTFLLTAVSDFLQNGSKVSLVNCSLVGSVIPGASINGVIPTAYLPSLHFLLLHFILLLEA